jgi:hypothetical protein
MRPFQRLAIDKNEHAIKTASVTARSIVIIVTFMECIDYILKPNIEGAGK